MSTNTSLHGTINITPDFTTPGSVPKFDAVKLEYRTVQKDVRDLFQTGQHVISAITADAPEWVDEEMVVADLTAIIAALPPETTYDGYFEARNRDYGDMWRAYIVDGKPIIVEPTITWPEPSSAGT
jgi:hypothetical protein